MEQLLAVQDRRSRVSSQAVPVVAASSPTTLPLLVWNASSQVVPPSFVSLTRVPPAESDTASQPRADPFLRNGSETRIRLNPRAGKRPIGCAKRWEVLLKIAP